MDNNYVDYLVISYYSTCNDIKQRNCFVYHSSHQSHGLARMPILHLNAHLPCSSSTLASYSFDIPSVIVVSYFVVPYFAYCDCCVAHLLWMVPLLSKLATMMISYGGAFGY